MLKRVGLGLALGLLFCGPAACGASLPQCQWSAVAALPLDDPDAITLGDTRALAARLRACSVETKDGDAGAR